MKNLIFVAWMNIDEHFRCVSEKLINHKARKIKHGIDYSIQNVSILYCNFQVTLNKKVESKVESRDSRARKKLQQKT